MFEVLDGLLSEKQIDWLFKQGHFPYHEDRVKDWQKRLKENFEITVGEPKLDFESLWDAYDHKAKKVESERKFSKLTDGQKVKCFMAIAGYNYYLKRKGTAKALLSTFIHQAYYEDDWYKAK